MKRKKLNNWQKIGLVGVIFLITHIYCEKNHSPRELSNKDYTVVVNGLLHALVALPPVKEPL
jgi:hypothetical protein